MSDYQEVLIFHIINMSQDSSGSLSATSTTLDLLRQGIPQKVIQNFDYHFLYLLNEMISEIIIP